MATTQVVLHLAILRQTAVALRVNSRVHNDVISSIGALHLRSLTPHREIQEMQYFVELRGYHVTGSLVPWIFAFRFPQVPCRWSE